MNPSNKPWRSLGLALLLASAAGISQAEEQAEREGLGLGVGVAYSPLGSGVEVYWQINDYFAVRGATGSADESMDDEEYDDIEYDADVELDSRALTLDIHPFGGSFFVAIGQAKLDNLIGLVGQLSQPVEIGNTTYNPEDIGSLTAALDISGSVPYVALGWRGVEPGFTVSFELGAASIDSPDALLSVTCGDAIVGTPQCDQLQDDAELERANLEDDASDLDFWPFARLGVAWQF